MSFLVGGQRIYGREVLLQAEKEHPGTGIWKALATWVKLVEIAR
jgi:hypothetical protein